MSRVVARREVIRARQGDPALSAMDSVAVEEPLEMRVSGRPLAVTMRTPGDDMDLFAGFLVTEGVVRIAADLAAMRYCAGAVDGAANTYNVLDATLAAGVAAPDPSIERAFYTTSSCGVCGKASIDAVRTVSPYELQTDRTAVDSDLLLALPARLRDSQQVFDRTGGLHAAGLFDAVSGELRVLREDVGRHNAVDKVVGWALRAGLLPLRGHLLLVSGRASFELTQKAAMAGIPILAAVSAPSSLALDLAAESGLTLIGFLRPPSFVVYTGVERVIHPRI